MHHGTPLIIGRLRGETKSAGRNREKPSPATNREAALRKRNIEVAIEDRQAYKTAASSVE